MVGVAEEEAEVAEEEPADETAAGIVVVETTLELGMITGPIPLIDAEPLRGMLVALELAPPTAELETPAGTEETPAAIDESTEEAEDDAIDCIDEAGTGPEDMADGD